MNEILISVIIPVYNGEKYIREAVMSITKQMNSQLEIILVNDGSTDNSEEICRALEQQFFNVKYFKKKNSGIGDTRNFGISKAQGKYLAFLDQDDVWINDFLNKEIVSIAQGDADILGFSYYCCNVDFTRGKFVETSQKKVFGGGIEGVTSSWAHHSSFLFNRKLVLENNIFCPCTRHEDEIFRHKCLYVAKKIMYINKPMFKYRNNPTSETHRKQCAENLYGPILNSWEELLQWHLELDPKDEEIIKLCKKMICIYGIEGIEQLYKSGISEKQIKEIVKKSFKDNILLEYPKYGMSEKNYKRIDKYYNSHTAFVIKNRIKGIVFTIAKTLFGLKIIRKIYEKKKYPLVMTD